MHDKTDLPSLEPRPDRKLEVTTGVVMTVVVHAALGLLVFLAALAPPEKANGTVLMPVLDAEILKWGEVMPQPGQLPWIANPEPAKPEPEEKPPEPPKPDQPTAEPDEETVVLKPEPPKKPETPRKPEQLEQPKQPVPPDATPRPYRGETNPAMPTNNLPVMGSPEGQHGGTGLSKQAEDLMWSRIVNALKQSLHLPTTLQGTEECGRLKTAVYVRVTEQGRLSLCDVKTSSGNVQFDAAVRSMCSAFSMGGRRLDLSGFSVVPGYRESLIRSGFNVNVTCR